MLHRLTRSTSIVSCTFRARLSLKVQRKPCWQGVGNSTLTTRSEAVCITDLDTVLSICDQEQRETLRNVSAAACKAIKGCCANKDLSEEKLVSLLLRVAALRYLWQQQYRHDTQKLDDISCMIERVAALTDVLAGGSSEQTLQAIERHPPLMSQHPNILAERMVNIKQLMPQADVPQLVAKRPSILCMETPLLKSKVQKAAQQLRALMPAIPWEGRLMQDSNLFMTFITLLDDVNFGSGSVSSR